MYTTVRILKINDDNTALVGCSTEACNGCKAQMFCNTQKDNSFVVKNDNSVQVKEGDEVEIFLPPGKTVASTALVFALPLVFFPVGYLFSVHFLSLNELLNALVGLGSMAFAFAVASLVSSRHRRSLMPVITRVI